MRNVEAPERQPAQGEAVRAARSRPPRPCVPSPGGRNATQRESRRRRSGGGGQCAGRAADPGIRVPPRRRERLRLKPRLTPSSCLDARGGDRGRSTRPAPAAGARALQAVLAERIAPQRELRNQAVALGRELADLRDRARPLSDRARGPEEPRRPWASKPRGRWTREPIGSRRVRPTPPVTPNARRPRSSARRPAGRGPRRGPPRTAGRPTPIRRRLPTIRHRRPRSPTRSAAMSQAAQQLAQARQGNGRRGNPGRGAGDAAGRPRPPRRRRPRLARRAATPTQRPQACLRNPTAPTPRGPWPGWVPPTWPSSRPRSHARPAAPRGELPGHLRTEILQMAQGRYRDDYARIIQLYFREIATGAERPVP